MASFAPASSRRVGSQSSKPVTRSLTRPAGILPVPPHDRRHADAALVERALQPAQRARRAEELRVRAADAVVGRAVVRREDDDRPLVEAQLADEVEDAPDLPVHARDHRRVGGPRRRVREVAVVAAVRRVGPEAPVLGERVLGHLESEVRHRRREKEEEGPVLVVANEGPGALGDEVGSVGLPGVPGVAPRIGRVGAVRQLLVDRERRVVEREPPIVVVEVRRVVVVRVALAVVAEEVVEALPQRVALGAGRAEPPLPHGGGRVALGLQELGDRDRRRRQRHLPLGLQLAVVPDGRVPRVLPGQEDAARGRADGVPRVVLREAHALGGEAVERGRADLLLSVAAELGVAEVVGEDEDDVGPRGCGGGRLGPPQRGAQEDASAAPRARTATG